MKKTIAIICLLALSLTCFASCSKKTCEYCGAEAMFLNLVGDEENGINVCDTCIEKMSLSKISFNFTCDECKEEILGKENEVVDGNETKIVCNKCYNN